MMTDDRIRTSIQAKARRDASTWKLTTRAWNIIGLLAAIGFVAILAIAGAIETAGL